MAEENVSFNFQAGGIADVQRAFSTIEQSTLALEKLAVASANREAMARVKASQKVTAARTKDEERVHRLLSQHDAAALARTVSLADARTHIAKKEADKRVAAALHMQKQLDTIEKDHTAKTLAEIAKRQKADEHAAAAALTRRKQMNGAIFGAAGSSLRGSLGTVARYGGMALGIAGGISVGSAVQKAMSAESKSVSLANSMFNPNDKDQQAFIADKKNAAYVKDGRLSSGALLGFARSTQAASGVDKDELLGGMQSYIAKSSDWESMTSKGGQDMHSELARLAKATDTSYGDVMNTAGSLKSQNKGLKTAEMLEMMYAIVGQGKSGAIEISDVAKYGSTITSSAGSYAGSQAEAQKRLLGLVQVSGRVASGGADAATGVARFAGDVSKHAKANQKLHPGMKVMDENGQLYAPSQILSEYFKATAGDTTKLGEGKGNLGLGMESIKVAMGAKGVYSAAVADAEAGRVDKDVRKNLALGDRKTFSKEDRVKIGAEAVRLDTKKLEDAAYNKATIDKDHALKMATLTERYAKVMAKLSDIIEARAVPFLEKLAVTLEKNEANIGKLFNAVADFAAYLVDNPIKGIGGIIAAKLVADIGQAAVGQVVGQAMAAMIGSSAMAGILGPLIGVAIAAAIATAAGKAAIDAAFKEKNEADTKTITQGQGLHEATLAFKRKVAAGTETSADIAAMQELERKSFQRTYGPDGLVTNRKETTLTEDVTGAPLWLKDLAVTPAKWAGGKVDNTEHERTAAEHQADRDTKAEAAIKEHNDVVAALRSAADALKLIAAKSGGGTAGAAPPPAGNRQHPIPVGTASF